MVKYYITSNEIRREAHDIIGRINKGSDSAKFINQPAPPSIKLSIG